MTLVRMGRSGGCPLCGTSGAACGHPSDSVPVDERMEVAAVGGPLKKYTVVTASGVETVMKLNEADAERLGGVPLEAPEPDTDEAAPAPATKKRTPRNKARAVADKAVKEEGGGG